MEENEYNIENLYVLQIQTDIEKNRRNMNILIALIAFVF